MKPSAEWHGADVILYQIYQINSKSKDQILLHFAVYAAMYGITFVLNGRHCGFNRLLPRKLEHPAGLTPQYDQ
jgi:hypothetical protein